MVGRRGEVDDRAGDEAEHRGELRAADQGGADHDEQREVGHDAVPGEVREEGDLEDHGQGHHAEGDERAQQVHRVPPGAWVPSALITPRPRVSPPGTTTPTRSREVKSTSGFTTARREVSRGLL